MQRPYHPYTGTLDWLYTHPLKIEDTLCLHLPQGAGPDTITMQRGEVGDSLTPGRALSGQPPLGAFTEAP